jgi:hypothetical protein
LTADGALPRIAKYEFDSGNRHVEGEAWDFLR